MTLAGANPGDFLVGANTCTGATLAPGAACSVGVQFTPHVDGSRAAVLAFASNDPASPTTRVALTGVGAWLTLRVEKSGSGRGAVTLNPGAKICTDACQLSLGYGAAADLTAKADPGSVFSGWSGGACLGVDPCLLSVVADTMVTATFSPVAEADAGQVALPLDGGQEVPIGDGGRLAGSDAGPDPLNEVTGSCGCQATAALPSSLGLFAFLAVLKRRRTALRP